MSNINLNNVTKKDTSKLILPFTKQHLSEYILKLYNEGYSLEEVLELTSEKYPLTGESDSMLSLVCGIYKSFENDQTKHK